MSTICLFGADYESPRALHEALKNLLEFPEYYGMNADALNDCLGEFPACPALWYALNGTEEVNAALKLAARIFADNGGEVKEL